MLRFSVTELVQAALWTTIVADANLYSWRGNALTRSTILLPGGSFFWCFILIDFPKIVFEVVRHLGDLLKLSLAYYEGSIVRRGIEVLG